MAASASQSEYVTALGPDEEHATSSCSELVTTKIELSKRHWSELSEPIVDGISCEEAAKAKLENEEAFKIWQLHPEWGPFFFKTFGYSFGRWASWGSLEVGKKFAEGAQAELFDVLVKWSHPENNEHDLKTGTRYVLKVFKEGTLVQDLQVQWPEGLFRYREEGQKHHKDGKPPRPRQICYVVCATLLKDGRFAFLMAKEDGDLRSVIEGNMEESDHGRGPFSRKVGEEIMYRVAEGMDFLHSYDIVHRDLKASNVLVKASRRKHLSCFVADFESSIGVIGTGFWRAPEILRACKEKNAHKRSEVFTREADSYSYGMTCYEVLTGRVPFEDHPLMDRPSLLMDLVIDQDLRPEVPDYVEDWARELLHWCWKSDSNGRPSFKEILGFLEAHSNSKYIEARISNRLKAECIDAKE